MPEMQPPNSRANLLVSVPMPTPVASAPPRPVKSPAPPPQPKPQQSIDDLFVPMRTPPTMLLPGGGASGKQRMRREGERERFFAREDNSLYSYSLMVREWMDLSKMLQTLQGQGERVPAYLVERAAWLRQHLFFEAERDGEKMRMRIEAEREMLRFAGEGGIRVGQTETAPVKKPKLANVMPEAREFIANPRKGRARFAKAAEPCGKCNDTGVIKRPADPVTGLGAHAVFCSCPVGRTKATEDVEKERKPVDGKSYRFALDSVAVSSFDSQYPIAKPVVDGRAVLRDIPNATSIGSSLGSEHGYTILPKVREIPLSIFKGLSGKSYSESETKRIADLAQQVAVSKKIKPLIVVHDGHSDGPYILEGGHRAEALFKLGAKSFPALVVIHHGAMSGPNRPQRLFLGAFREVQRFGFRAPAGGMISRGVFYTGGKMLPKQATTAPSVAPRRDKPVRMAGGNDLAKAIREVLSWKAA